MEKEELYEIIKSTNLSMIGWSTFKKEVPKLNRLEFHKLCGELVGEGLLKENRYSNLICYHVF